MEPMETWYRVLSHATSSRSSHASCVESLIEAGVDVNNEVLNMAVKKDFDKCLEVFVRAGADVNSIEGAKALEETCHWNECDKCLDVMLKAGANVNSDSGFRALENAAKRGYYKCLNLYICRSWCEHGK